MAGAGAGDMGWRPDGGRSDRRFRCSQCRPRRTVGLAGAGWALRVRQTGGRPGSERRSFQGRRSFRLCPRNQLWPQVRSTDGGEPDQPRLHRPWPSGPYRQPLPRPGADGSGALLPRKLRRRGREHGGRRVPRRRTPAGRGRSRLRCPHPLLRPIRICGGGGRAPPLPPPDDRTQPRWRADRGAVQQPLPRRRH